MVSAKKLWTIYLVSSLIALALVAGISWVIVYYFAWLPLVHEGLPKLPKLLAELDLANTLWWRDALAVAFDILIIVVAVIGTWWSIGHFAALAREQGKWWRYYHSEESKRDQWIQRLTLWQRIQHVWMIITFVICAFTGFVMYLGNNPYWKELYVSRELYVTLHIYSGIAMGILVILHFAYYTVRGLLAKLEGKSLMKEFPILQLYTAKFLKDLVKRLLWTVTARVASPKFHKYNSEQLFEYWGIYWGIAILGIPGIIMAIYGPAVLDGVLWVMHVKEAVLAVVFLLLVHITYTHFNPTVFPLNTVFIHGKMPLRQVEEEHPEWYEELARGESRGKA